jgi:hypothetical protein
MKTNKKFLALELTVTGLVEVYCMSFYLFLGVHLFSSSVVVQNVLCISPVNVTLPIKSNGVKMNLWFLL